MRRLNKAFFIIFIPTLIFLIIFTGFYLLIRMNFSLSNDYEVFSFSGGKPSNMHIILIGFRNFQEAFYFILLTAIFAIIGVHFIRGRLIGNADKNRTILNSLVLTVLLALLYLVYKLLYSIDFDKDYFNIYWKDIQREAIILSISYFLISIPITFLVSKQIAKSPKV